MMALYELEGSMLLCQAFKKNVLAPEFNWFVASGWWNQNFITLTAGTAKVPCTVNELHRASYSLIASDRGPMLNTQDIHSLSRRTLADLYSEYTDECQGWANGKGSCNHQWAGYFYDGIWLIASILHTFLIDQNRPGTRKRETSAHIHTNTSLLYSEWKWNLRNRRFSDCEIIQAHANTVSSSGQVCSRIGNEPVSGSSVSVTLTFEKIH